MNLSRPKTNIWILLAIYVFAIALAGLLSQTSVFQTLELKLLDLRFSLRGQRDVSQSPIIIVAIDDQSDESTPHRWPWPRYYYAHLIENLERAEAAVIVLDVILDQPDRTGAQSDQALIDVLQRYDNIVLTGKLFRTSHAYSYSSLMPPYEPFRQNSSWGLAAIEADLDGFYRRYPLGQAYNDSVYPSLAAQALKLWLKSDASEAIINQSDHYQIGEQVIPKIDQMGLLVNYNGPAHTFTYYSFETVLDDAGFDLLEDYDMDAFDDPGDPELGIPPGPLPAGVFKDKIVLIGATMHELHDNFPTPFLEYTTPEGDKARAEMPGVEIHANALQTILSEDYLHQPPTAVTFLILVLLTGLVFVINRYLSTTLAALAALALSVLYVLAALTAFSQANLVLNASLGVMIVVLTYTGQTIYSYLLTQQEKRMLRGAFAYYVPEKVVQEIITNPDRLTLGGEERVVTVLFSDVAGFTSISEKLKPHDLVALLNDYLTDMTNIVLKHSGIIDKFEGDAIMAEFGVPVAFEGHERSACMAAIEMQRELREKRARWAREGRPALHARIGINTGEVIVGNMGSRDVFDYTVMGDHVNLGSRLEGANKTYGTEIMISEFTYQIVKKDFYTRQLDLIRVKGKQKPVAVYELIADRSEKLSDDYFDLLHLYHEGLKAYRGRQWSDAINLFARCLQLMPGDKASALYLYRCREFALKPPGPDWDGVTTMTTK